MRYDPDRIVALQPNGSRPPLFCVHAVSGSAYSYVELTRRLGTDQPVYGFEAPGFDNDRAPVRSVASLADEYTATLRECHPSVDYRLLGWSLGGLVAFEMAKRLAAAGTPATALIMIDSGLPTALPLPSERDILRRFVRDMMGLSDETPPEVDAVFDGLPGDVAPDIAFDAVIAAAILPDELDAVLLANQYSVFRALLEGFYSAKVVGPYTGPAVHVMAERSPAEEMRWAQIIPGLEQHTLTSTTHHSILTGSHLVTLAGIVRRELDVPHLAHAL